MYTSNVSGSSSSQRVNSSTSSGGVAEKANFDISNSDIGIDRAEILRAKEQLASNGFAKVRLTGAHAGKLMEHFNQFNERADSRRNGTSSILSTLDTNSPYMQKMTNIMQEITGHNLTADEGRCNIRHHNTKQTSHNWHIDSFGVIATTTLRGPDGALFVKPGTEGQHFHYNPEKPVYPIPNPEKNVDDITHRARNDEILIFFGDPSFSSSDRGQPIGAPTIHCSPDKTNRTVPTLRWSSSGESN